jgi:hypothetical protein
MRVPVTPFGIDFGLVIGMNGLSPELGGMGQFPCRPGFRFEIPV